MFEISEKKILAEIEKLKKTVEDLKNSLGRASFTSQASSPVENSQMTQESEAEIHVAQAVEPQVAHMDSGCKEIPVAKKRVVQQAKNEMHQRPQYTDFKDGEITIEKFFYSGNRR